MGRLVAVLIGCAMLAGACGDSSSGDGESVDSDPGGVSGELEVCADAEIAAPDLLPVGQVMELADEGSDHVVCPSYPHTPPASGPHFPAWQNCGFYTSPVQDQTSVHSLEHGAVWIAYRPDLDPAVIDRIRERLGVERHVLAAPYPGLQNPIVLTAWTRQLAVDDWDDPAVEQFLSDFTGDRSPVAPEAGASCGDAVGSPPDAPNANFSEILDQVG